MGNRQAQFSDHEVYTEFELSNSKNSGFRHSDFRTTMSKHNRFN